MISYGPKFSQEPSNTYTNIIKLLVHDYALVDGLVHIIGTTQWNS